MCEIKDLSEKLLNILCHQKKIIFFFCMYKMYLISAEGYKNAKVVAKIVRETGEIWVGMKDDGNGVGVKTSDLVLKEIYGICETKILQKNKLMNIKWQKEKFIKSLLI